MAKEKGITHSIEENQSITAFLEGKLGNIRHSKQGILQPNGTRSNRHFGIVNETAGVVVGTAKRRMVVGASEQMLAQIKPLAIVLDDLGFNVGSLGNHKSGLYLENNNSKASLYVEHRESQAEVAIGDIVGFGAMIKWGIDGLSAQAVDTYLNRLACLNGMTAKEGTGFSFYAKHTDGFAGRQTALRDGFKGAIRNWTQALPDFKALVEKKLSSEQARKVVEEALGVRKGKEAIELWGNGRGQNGVLDAWNLYNSVTQIATDNWSDGSESTKALELLTAIA